MAQAGYTPISLYYSTTAAAVPTAGNLVAGELAINIVDGKLYYENSSGVVTLLASSTTVTNSFSAGTTGFTPSTATTGAVTLGGTLITSNGGTGLASYTAGDLSYYASGTALTKLAIGTAGQFLTSTGTAPQWSTLSGVAVTTFSAGTTGFTPNTATSGAITLAGTLATTNGGTGLTSYTANGVLYASSSSALTSGSALVFDGTNLGIGISPLANNNLTMYGTTYSQFHMQNSSTGTGATDGFRILSQGLDVTLTNHDAGYMVFETSNTERVRITSAGNVGIGATPDAKLTVSGGLATTGIVARFVNQVSGGNAKIGFSDTLTYNWTVGTTNDNFTISSAEYGTIAGTERMRITGAGNVGIGTTTPSDLLQVVSATVDPYVTIGNGNGRDCGLKLNASTGFTALRTDASNPLYISSGTGFMMLSTNGSERMRITAAGNVGIGFAAPDQPLAFADSIGVKMQLNGSNANGYQIAMASSVAGGDAMMKFIAGETGAGEIGWYYSTNLRMLMDSSGKFLIGGATSAVGRLTVKAASNTYLEGITTINPAGNYWTILSNVANNLYVGYNNGDVGYFSNSTGVYTPLSDGRAKKNITDIEYGLDAVLALRSVQYHMNEQEDTEKKNIGFIAQEAMEVVPESVSLMMGGMYGMDRTSIVPVLVKAIQEQQAIILSLKARLDAANL